MSVFERVYFSLSFALLFPLTQDALLYDDEWQAILEKYPNNFKVDYALSREGPLNKKGGKMYIQV